MREVLTASENIMPATRKDVLITVTTILAIAIGNMVHNASTSYEDIIGPGKVDPSIPIPFANVTYLTHSNTLLVDNAREWLLQSQSSDIKILNAILWVVTASTSTLVYAPYHEYHTILRDYNLTNTIVLIEKNQRWAQDSISIVAYYVRNECNLTELYNAGEVFQKHHWCAERIFTRYAPTNGFFLNVNGDPYAYKNMFGGAVASAEEIISVAVFEAVMVLSVLTLLTIFLFIHEDPVPFKVMLILCMVTLTVIFLMNRKYPISAPPKSNLSPIVVQ